MALFAENCRTVRQRIAPRGPKQRVRLLTLVNDVPGETQTERAAEGLRRLLDSVEGVLSVRVELSEIIVAVEHSKSAAVKRSLRRAPRDIRLAFSDL